MGNRNNIILNKRGQSTVEYILLLAVVISLIYVVINSVRFKELMGQGGTLGTNMRLEAEWNYRFAKPRNGLTTTWSGVTADHPSYWNSTRSATHFIGPLKPYPE
jgi:hypothetical protein